MSSRRCSTLIPLRSSKTVTLLVIAFLPVSLSAQTAAKGDPQAVAVLNQALAVTGWALPPNDVVAQAAVTEFKGEQPVIHTVTWKAMGAAGLRIEVDTPEGRSTIVKNGHRGSFAQGTKSSRLTGHAAATMHSIQFPFLLLAALASEPNTEVTYRGVEPLNGENTHVIELRARQNSDSPNDSLSQAWRFVLYVSAGALLPVRVDYNRLGADNSNVVLHCSRLFSDYRRLGAFLVPYQQSDFVEGRKVADIQITQIQLNAGVSPTEFDIAN